MIPREILKKIRQIELRTNRILSETLTSVLSKSPTESVRISVWMPNGDHPNFHPFDCEVNPVFKPRHARFADSVGFFLKQFGILFDALKQREKFGVKFPAQSGLALFVPVQGLQVIQIGGRFKPHAPHFQPKRLEACSRTCSNGIPSSGFLYPSRGEIQRAMIIGLITSSTKA